MITFAVQTTGEIMLFDELPFMHGYAYEGNLSLRFFNITSLPDNMTVGGFLELSFSMIDELPNNLTIHNNLYLYGLGMTTIPPTVIVKGNVYGLV